MNGRQVEVDTMYDEIRELKEKYHKAQQSMHKEMRYIVGSIIILGLILDFWGIADYTTIFFILIFSFSFVSFKMIWEMKCEHEYRYNVIGEYLKALTIITTRYLR